jgi:aspartyl-tRNA synthetase
LAWIGLDEKGESHGSIARFFDAEFVKEMLRRANEDDTAKLLLIADADVRIAQEAAGALRLEVARRRNMIPEGMFEFCWVTAFPLFEWSEDNQRLVAKHHPFTAPVEEDVPFLDTDPLSVRAHAYDIVLNGTELGGGSIRIHQQDLQKRMFSCLGFSEEQASRQFGFLLKAFEYGVPPHGGIAYGLDRLVMKMLDEDNIREVIAFPKVQTSSCLMTGAPDRVDDGQLDELKLRIELPKKPESAKV